MRGGETLDELEAFAAHVRDHGETYGIGAGSIAFVALCVDVSTVSGARAALLRWPSLRHFALPERSLRELRVTHVPSRLLVDSNGVVRKAWDGTHGRVLLGRHGASLRNGSHTLMQEILAVFHDDAKA